MKDLIIVNVPSNSSIASIRETDHLLKNRTLGKYCQTDVIYLTINRGIYSKIKDAGFMAELSFLLGENSGSMSEPFIGLISAIYIFKKISIDDIRNVAVFNSVYLLTKDLKDFYSDLSNSIKFDGDNIIYGGSMPMIVLSSIFHDYFIHGRKISSSLIVDTCDSLNIDLEEQEIDLIHV